MNEVEKQLRSARPWLGPKKVELIDRIGMREDLLAMAERAMRNLRLVDQRMSNVDWFDCYRHAVNCYSLEAELSQRNTGAERV
jgi:hypothetical protein